MDADSADGLTAIILCGGEGRRMGGADKALLVFGGRPLIERVIAAVSPQVMQVVLSARRNLALYQRFGRAVVADDDPAGQGPLAGLLAALAASASDVVLCVPGDAPLLPADLAARLAAARRLENADIAVVHDGVGMQPLCALMPRSLVMDLREYLNGGGRAPREWFARHRLAQVDFSAHPRWAWSLNTPQEWAAAELRLSEHERGALK